MRSSRAGDAVSRFRERYEIDDVSGCWIWTGRKNAKGYGVIGGAINGYRYVPSGVSMLAHRVSWIIHRGDIPESQAAHGTVVMHSCDNPSCVNPDHLALGTQADNIRDMYGKRRRQNTTPTGPEHWNASFKNQADIDLICSTKGQTKELAAKYGVNVSTIKNLRRRHGLGTQDPEKFARKKLSQEVIDHIRSTPAGTRGLTELYGLSKTAISRIRKGLSYK